MANNEATKGARVVAGWRPGATWGTEVLVGAGHGVEIISSQKTTDVQLVDRMDELSGSSQARAGDKGTETHKLSIVAPAKYETLATMLAQAMGTAATPVQQGATTAYLHKLSSAADIIGQFGTYVEDWQLYVEEHVSVKLTGWTLEIDAATQRGRITFEGVSYKLNTNTGSGTNKTSTIASITLSTSRARLLFANLAVRMNAQSGGALSSTGGTFNTGDLQYLASFKVSYKRPHLENDFTLEHGFRISEPHQNGKTVVSVTLGFSKFATDNVDRMADMLARTPQKMDAIFTSSEEAGTAYPYKMSLYLNAVQFAGRPQIGGPGLAAWSLEGVAHEVAAIGTGMPTAYTQALHLDIVNTLAVNAITLA